MSAAPIVVVDRICKTFPPGHGRIALRRIGPGNQQSHFVRAVVDIGLGNDFEVLQCNLGLACVECRTGGAPADFQVVGKWPLHAGLKVLQRLLGLAGLQQGLRQTNLVLCRGRVIKCSLSVTQIACRVQRFDGLRCQLARAAL